MLKEGGDTSDAEVGIGRGRQQETRVPQGQQGKGQQEVQAPQGQQDTQVPQGQLSSVGSSTHLGAHVSVQRFGHLRVKGGHDLDGQGGKKAATSRVGEESRRTQQGSREQQGSISTHTHTRAYHPPPPPHLRQHLDDAGLQAQVRQVLSHLQADEAPAHHRRRLGAAGRNPLLDGASARGIWCHTRAHK